MGLTNVARDAIATAIATGTLGVTAFNNANSYVGVGNSAAAYSAAHTDLQGASKLRKAVSAGYPTQAANVLTYQATFGLTEAVWDWNEFGVFNAASGGTMLNRKPQSLGTKPNTEAWQLTVTLTLTAA